MTLLKATLGLLPPPVVIEVVVPPESDESSSWFELDLDRSGLGESLVIVSDIGVEGTEVSLRFEANQPLLLSGRCFANSPVT